MGDEFEQKWYLHITLKIEGPQKCFKMKFRIPVLNSCLEFLSWTQCLIYPLKEVVEQIYDRMTEINKEAYKQAEKELLEKRVNEVKGFILETLEKIERKKKEKAKIEEELRVLKLDIEDMKNGKFDKIEERIEKSSVARGVSIVVVPSWDNTIPCGSQNLTWSGLVSGTYTVSNGRSFYI